MISHIATIAGLMQRQVTTNRLQAEIGQLTNEVSSGVRTDAAKDAGVDAALLYQLHADADQQGSIQSVTQAAGLKLDTMQKALAGIGKAASDMSSQALDAYQNGPTSYKAVAESARQEMGQVLDLLNTQYNGHALFAGADSNGTPMATIDDPSTGPLATISGFPSAAATAKGGPLTKDDIDNFLNGTDGLSSLFTDTNSDPTKNYAGVFYTAANGADPTQPIQPTKILVGTSQTISYNVNGNQQPFRDVLKGLAMLSMLDAPSSQLDDDAKKELASRTSTVLSNAQADVTTASGVLGVTQQTLERVADVQKAASNVTQQQLSKLEMPDTVAEAGRLSALQTQLQATYAITASLAKLSFVNYMS